MKTYIKPETCVTLVKSSVLRSVSEGLAIGDDEIDNEEDILVRESEYYRKNSWWGGVW